MQLTTTSTQERTVETLGAAVTAEMAAHYTLVYNSQGDTLPENVVAALVRGDTVWETKGGDALSEWESEVQWTAARDAVDELAKEITQRWEREDTYRDDDTDNPIHESSTLREIRATTAALLREPPSSYIPGRWPHTYAADFLRSHPELLPTSVREAVGTIDSRHTASQSVGRWAQELGVPTDEIKAILADAYLEQHHIPLGFADDERAAHRRKVQDAHPMG